MPFIWHTAIHVASVRLHKNIRTVVIYEKISFNINTVENETVNTIVHFQHIVPEPISTVTVSAVESYICLLNACRTNISMFICMAGHMNKNLLYINTVYK